MGSGTPGGCQRGPVLIGPTSSTLVVVDVQKQLLPKMRKRKALLARLRALVKAARLLEVPTVFTEHCAEAIGGVDAALLAQARGAVVIGKRAFRSGAEAEFTSHLVNLGRDQIVLAGIEAHVCVLQTAMDLADRGYAVFVVEDAVSARNKRDRACALERMTQSGIVRVTTEMVLFEWCETGDHPVFRKLLPTVKKLARTE